jgi:hypothetical protein
MFAKRGKKAFKGPLLNSSLFAGERSSSLGSPAVGASMNRMGSEGRLNLGLRDLAKRARGGSGENTAHRKSLILEEEEEEEELADQALIEEDEDVEEVEDFSDVETNLRRGERVHSVVFYDEPLESAGLDVRDGLGREEVEKA